MVRSYTDERCLLALLGGSPLPETAPLEIRPAPFLRLCHRHRVGSLAYQGMIGRDLEWPREILEPLLKIRKKTLVDNMVLLRVLQEIAGALGEEKIPFLVLKGASLLGFLYPEIHLRPMSDLDLLIRKDDWPRVARILRDRGYGMPTEEEERFYHENWYHHLLQSPGRPTCNVEFHWNIESEERSRIDPEELFREARPFEIDGNEYHRLGDPHLLVHLLVHLAHHYQRPSLHWVEDLRRFVGRDGLDWQEVGERARAWRVENCLAYSLQYLEHAFPGSVPRTARGFRLSPLRRLILRTFPTEDPTLPHRPLEGKPLRHAISMVLLDRWRDVARYISVHSVLRAVRWFRPRKPSRREWRG